MITRYSSRRHSLSSFLPGLLAGATRYDRIAGYFSSSILEVAGEALECMAPGAKVRVVCNSDLSPLDVFTARAAKQAMAREWRASLPDDIGPALRARLERLGDFLTSRRMEVRVLPDDRFGLIHGKAGVVWRDGLQPIAFIGSANETRPAWEMNYEIVWTDDSPEGVKWVEEEFDALWGDHRAVDLADAVIQEVVRLTRRVVLPALPGWREGDAAEAAAAIELPIYRRETGLWAHQKWFVRHAFERHKEGGARLVLADQVGLGKTIQLALAAKLMILWGGGNVLALVPKPLLDQWRDELWDLLRLPCAIWRGDGWEDEREVFHPAPGPDGLRKCPRKLGLVSTGLIKQSPEVREMLAGMTWECVILDEAHHARRTNLAPSKKNEQAQPNNLLTFLMDVAGQTKSLLLATATPVQIDPIEAFDLLHALNRSNRTVLGSHYGPWINRRREGLALVSQHQQPPDNLPDRWEWIRDPFPQADEHTDFRMLRKSLGPPPDRQTYRPEDLDRLHGPARARLRRVSDRFFAEHNPYILHIVRRTREFLENEIDPQTHEPYLPQVEVRLYGEAENESVYLPGHLSDAFAAAEKFCQEVGKRPHMNAGFLKTMLLRRVGSTIIAGRITAERMLGPTPASLADEEQGDDEDESPLSALYPLSPAEEEHLRRFLDLLALAPDDPKYREVERILLDGVPGTSPWLERGCIIFSQFYDSALWIAGKLSDRLPEESVAVYAGSGRSGLYRAGVFTRIDREEIKRGVRSGQLRLVVGTDAASEGLNLQRLGTLINLDLPWNPTRLEQRKGRIQRIGQPRPEVYVYNLRYRGSVEDRVHQLLSDRLLAISTLFGQVPDTLEDVWVEVALHNEAEAQKLIDAVPNDHPFEMRYDRIEPVDWESCSRVLDAQTQLDALIKGW